MKSRHEAEERRIEAEEMQTSVSVARDLADKRLVDVYKRQVAATRVATSEVTV